ncbi:hypothetical protein PENTCL1PPCAC_29302, partial [Pristionchus entomophagus]
ERLAARSSYSKRSSLVSPWTEPKDTSNEFPASTEEHLTEVRGGRAEQHEIQHLSRNGQAVSDRLDQAPSSLKNRFFHRVPDH